MRRISILLTETSIKNIKNRVKNTVEIILYLLIRITQYTIWYILSKIKMILLTNFSYQKLLICKYHHYYFVFFQVFFKKKKRISNNTHNQVLISNKKKKNLTHHCILDFTQNQSNNLKYLIK